ncbi:MAG: DUF4214 domain-containing protein [Clostridiales bacterium]|nr:DUF4214 domain-containing protein [Clostridiales bacterium]
MKKRWLKAASILLAAVLAFASVPFFTAMAKAADVDAQTSEEAGEDAEICEFVSRLYRVCLKRDPDYDGLNYWTDELQNKKETGVAVASGFIFSPELQNKSYTNTEYVEVMYDAFFGREADSEGLKFWVKSMDDGMTRAQVFSGFANSLEFFNLCSSFDVVAGTHNPEYDFNNVIRTNFFVERLYNVVLGRKCDKDGMMYWTTQLLSGNISGTQAAYGFFFSKEYENSNKFYSEYIHDLYNAMMGREAEEDGFNFWMKEMKNGSTKERIFNNFATSEEFGMICSEYGILRGNPVSEERDTTYTLRPDVENPKPTNTTVAKATTKPTATSAAKPTVKPTGTKQPTAAVSPIAKPTTSGKPTSSAKPTVTSASKLTVTPIKKPTVKPTGTKQPTAAVSPIAKPTTSGKPTSSAKPTVTSASKLTATPIKKPTVKPTNLTTTLTPTKKATDTPTPPPVTAKLKSTTLEIMKGTFGDIRFVDNGKEVTVNGATFKSADASIATVYADGSVAGLKEGNTKITVTYGGKTETISVAVKSQINNGSSISGALTPDKYAEIGKGNTDCTQAFRKLFKDAYDGGTVSDGIRRAKPIYIPSGHYVIHGSIIDSSMNIDNCVFEVYGSGRESTRITFDRDGTLFDASACSPFVFTTFSNIGFFGNQNNTLLSLPKTDLTSQIKKPELQRIRFVSCSFKGFKHILYTERSSGMISEIELAYCKITSCGTESNMSKMFVLDDKKVLKLNSWYTDIESFNGDCFYYKSGAIVRVTGGSIIPSTGCVFFFDFSDSSRNLSAGSKTTPHLICENARFELRGTTCCVKTTSISQDYPIAYFKNTGMGTIANETPNGLIINGGGDFIFQDCMDSASLSIYSKITSGSTLKPRVRFYGCADIKPDSLAKKANITNPATDANCVRVTIDDSFDFYLKNNSGSMKRFLHNASGLKDCRQLVNLDDFDYVYPEAHSYSTYPYGYIRYAELTVPENTTYKGKTVNVTFKDKITGQKLGEQNVTLGAGRTYKIDINRDVEELEVTVKQSFLTSAPVNIKMNLQILKSRNPVADTAPVPVVSSPSDGYTSVEVDAGEETSRTGSLKPQDFGAVADGKTDCTSAFRAMFKAAADFDKNSNSWKSSQAIYIPSGVYRIEGPVIDESLGLKYCKFEVSGAGSDNTIIEFVNNGIMFDSEVKDQSNTTVPFAFTTFRNITFIGNNNNTFMTLKMNNKNKEGKNTDGTQRMQFFSCSFKNWKRVLYSIESTVMLSEFTFSDCKIDDCGTDSVPCQLFTLDDAQAVNWRFLNTDITNFTGDAFYYIRGTSIAITGGSIIPKAGNAFFFDFNNQARRDSAGPGNSPQLICKSVKFGINANSSCVKTTSMSQGAPVIRFDGCNLGTTSYSSRQFLMINGAAEIRFTDCTGCGKLRFSGYIGSEMGVRPRIQFWGCNDLDLDTLVNDSDVTNAKKDFNNIRVTVGNEYDFFMKKNDSGLPYRHTVGGLNYCRQAVKLDAGNYVVSGKAYSARPYGYVSYAELAVPAASTYSGKTITVTLKEKSTGKVYAQQQITLGSEQKVKLSVESYVDELEVVFTHSLSTGSSTKIEMKLELVKY